MQTSSPDPDCRAPRAAVFNFLADIEHLPAWTGGFCEWIELHREGWWAYTAVGELAVETKADDITGEVDLRLRHVSGWRSSSVARALRWRGWLPCQRRLCPAGRARRRAIRAAFRVAARRPAQPGDAVPGRGRRGVKHHQGRRLRRPRALGSAPAPTYMRAARFTRRLRPAHRTYRQRRDIVLPCDLVFA